MTDSVNRLRPDEVAVPSFTEDDVHYVVNTRTGDCTDPGRRYNATLTSCKHTRLVKAIEGSALDLKEATRGLTKDGTPVVVLTTRTAAYIKRTWGFDAGVYSHELCFDGKNLMVVSTDLFNGEEQQRTVYDASRWDRHIPPAQEVGPPNAHQEPPSGTTRIGTPAPNAQ